MWLNSILGPYCGQSEKLAANTLVSHPTVTKQRVVQLARCSQAALEVWPGTPCLTLWTASGHPALYGRFAFTHRACFLIRCSYCPGYGRTGSGGVSAGSAALRSSGTLYKASLTSVPLTPRRYPLQRKLSYHLEPGPSWEGDEALV